MEEEEMRVFQTSGVIKILLYLHDHPEGAQKTTIRDDLKLSPYTGVRAHQALESLNVFKKKISPENRIFYMLNEKGEKIASTLVEIGRCLRSPSAETEHDKDD